MKSIRSTINSGERFSNNASNHNCKNNIFHIFGALAEVERSIIKERTLASLKVARVMGRTDGRPPSLKEEDIVVAKALLKDVILLLRR